MFIATDPRVSKIKWVAVNECILEDTIIHILRNYPYHEIAF